VKGRGVIDALRGILDKVVLDPLAGFNQPDNIEEPSLLFQLFP
jgi:hypothetical protein